MYYIISSVFLSNLNDHVFMATLMCTENAILTGDRSLKSIL
jgi:hypothetical protein